MGFLDALNSLGKTLQETVEYKHKYESLSNKELIEKFDFWGCSITEKTAIKEILKERGVW